MSTPEATSEGFIAKAPIRRMMKEVGAYLVADDATNFLIGYLQKLGTDVTKKALEIVDKAGLKKLTANDIIQAAKDLGM